MATFTGGVEATTYDLTQWVPDMQGEIPEPSTAQVEDFMAVLRQVMPTKVTESGEVTLDVPAIKAFFEEHEEDDFAEELINDAVSALCSNTPTADQIRQLPHRVKQGFYGFVIGTYLSPEA
jgi:hypothetical protein